MNNLEKYRVSENKIQSILKQLTYNTPNDISHREHLDNIAVYTEIARNGSNYDMQEIQSPANLEDFEVKHFVESLDKIKNGQNLSNIEQKDF